MSKTHTLKCAAYNLGLLLRKVWGYCKPRNAAAATALFFGLLMLWVLVAPVKLAITNQAAVWLLCPASLLLVSAVANPIAQFIGSRLKNGHSLTGC